MKKNSPPKAAGEQPINPAQAVLALAIIVFGIFGSMTIWAEMPKGETWQYWIAGISGALVLIFGVIVFLQSRRKDKCPDLLAALPIPPYECEGVLLVPVFSPVPARPGGTLRHAFFYQNRFDGSASLELATRPGAAWKLDIGAAEVGLIWIDVLVSPPEGKMELQVAIFASGRKTAGKEVRFRSGGVLNDPNKLDKLTLAAAAVGHAVIKTAASITIPVSVQGREAPAPNEPQGRLILWQPDRAQEAIRAAWSQACSIVGISAG
jgi:hypothetical protein